MDDLISARYGELLSGADRLNQNTGQLSDSSDELLNDSRALTSDAWCDEVADAAMTDTQFHYGLRQEDIHLNQRTVEAINSGTMNYKDLQTRSRLNYLR